MAGRQKAEESAAKSSALGFIDDNQFQVERGMSAEARPSLIDGIRGR
jgi:hypothetical protein